MTLFCIIVNDIHHKGSWKRRGIHTATCDALETGGKFNAWLAFQALLYWNRRGA
jgi:hypothetical protein